jgi:hypothetical protein
MSFTPASRPARAKRRAHGRFRFGRRGRAAIARDAPKGLDQRRERRTDRSERTKPESAQTELASIVGNREFAGLARGPLASSQPGDPAERKADANDGLGR